MAGAVMLGLPLPLLPVHLLWMNLVGDGFPASALGTQPPTPGLMAQRPEPPGAPLRPDFSRQVFAHGLTSGLAATGLYAWALATGRPLPRARTLAMATLAAGQIHHLHACRSPGPAGQVQTAANVAAGLTLACIYCPPLRSALQLTPLGLSDLALVGGVALAASGSGGGRAG